MKLQIWLFTILVIFQHNLLSLQSYVFYFIHLKTLSGKEPGKGANDTPQTRHSKETGTVSVLQTIWSRIWMTPNNCSINYM